MIFFSLGDDGLLALEQKLKAELNPVQPDDEFVRGLKNRLEASLSDYTRRITAARLLMIATGVTVGFAVFFIGREFLRENQRA